MRPRRLAQLRLYPGMTIPADLTVVAAHYDVTRDLSFVILTGDDLPEVVEGCRPDEVWTVVRLAELRERTRREEKK